MFATGTAMSAMAENSYLIYKVCPFHCCKGAMFLGIVFAELIKKLMKNIFAIIISCFVVFFLSCSPKNQGMINIPHA
jgi:hypothetical protein